MVAPGVPDDAEYWLEWWWWRHGGGAPESLRVNLDPDWPDFFDYVKNEWYDVPIRGRRGHVAGPYVDYACTNQYTFTFSVPVYHGDRPLGVAAMDVPCDQIERRIMPALCADPVARTLLNPNGRVIAAGGGGVATAVPSMESTDLAALARLCRLTGWSAVPQPSDSAAPSA